MGQLIPFLLLIATTAATGHMQLPEDTEKPYWWGLPLQLMLSMSKRVCYTLRLASQSRKSRDTLEKSRNCCGLCLQFLPVDSIFFWLKYDWTHVSCDIMWLSFAAHKVRTCLHHLTSHLFLGEIQCVAGQFPIWGWCLIVIVDLHLGAWMGSRFFFSTGQWFHQNQWVCSFLGLVFSMIFVCFLKVICFLHDALPKKVCVQLLPREHLKHTAYNYVHMYIYIYDAYTVQTCI